MEESIFIRTLGNYPLIRVFDFLIFSRDFDYPITEIAKNANVNFVTLKKLWPKLEEDKIIIETRILAGAKLYKLNVDNPIVKKLIELNEFLCWQHVEQMSEKEVVH